MSAPTNSLPRPRRRALGALSARPVRRQAVSSRRSAPAPGCTALGKSPRARPSSIHRRDTRSGADGRSAAGSTMSPNVGPGGGHDVDHSRSPRLGQARASRPQPSLCLRGGPARSSSADRSRPAWLSSGAWHVGRCATAQSTPDTPDRPSESPRCDVALARQSTGLSGADGNVTHPGALSSQDRDLFPLRKGQVASRSGRQADRRHTTALTEPTTTHGRRHATGHSGILTRQPPRDRLPEPLLLRTPRCRRPTRRTHRRPTRPV